MPEDPLLAVADSLYAEPPAGFTPRRDALAKELKGSDKELSAAVKALRKPSLAAWVVNLLVRREAGQVAQVLSVGEALREAQAAMSGQELRALTRQRRQLTAAVTTRARALAGEAGVRVTPAVAEQVEATLTAAMLDERAAAAVRSGLLLAALSATGLDVVDVDTAVAVPEALGFAATPVAGAASVGEGEDGGDPSGGPGLHVVPDPDADAKALAAARETLAGAEAGLERARESLDAAAAEAGELQARVLQLQGEADELRRRLAELESAADEADDELSDAEDVRAEAGRALQAATHERDAAAAVVGRLGGGSAAPG